MKKNFLSYAVVWAIGFAIFNVVTFLIPSEAREAAGFWTGYAFITLAFILQIGTSFFAFKDGRKDRLFFNIPTISITFITLVCTIIIAAVTVAIPAIPEWLGTILCFICLLVGVAATLLAKTAAEAVSDIDEKIKNNTFFIKSLTVDANTLVLKAQTPEIRSELTKVYEAIRYSDPMSKDALAGAESQITLKFNELQNVVAQNDAQAVKTVSDELIILISDRNSKCKLLK